MKKFITLLLTFAFAISIVACSSSNNTTSDSETTLSETTQEETEESTTEQEPPTTESAEEILSISEYEALLSSQAVTVIHTEYKVQDEQYKSLYPDMLQAVIQNNTDEDIKNAIVAFVAWDENQLPVKIEGQFSFSGGSYITEVNYSDINLVGGATFGESNGYSLKENNNIDTFKAIVVSYETFDGNTWENPYYAAFKTTYEGAKYTDELTFEVVITDDTTISDTSDNTEPAAEAPAVDTISVAELDALLLLEPVTVVHTEYKIQDERYKSLYPDMLQAVIQNNTDKDIKNAIVAFVAWDENQLPIKIEGQLSFSGGSYVVEVNYSDINLVGGATFGESNGYSLKENNGIDTFKAIVVSYETFEGESWTNPHYDTFKTLFEGQRFVQ